MPNEILIFGLPGNSKLRRSAGRATLGYHSIAGTQTQVLPCGPRLGSLNRIHFMHWRQFASQMSRPLVLCILSTEKLPGGWAQANPKDPQMWLRYVTSESGSRPPPNGVGGLTESHRVLLFRCELTEGMLNLDVRRLEEACTTVQRR
jgi:hypothetical protein